MDRLRRHPDADRRLDRLLQGLIALFDDEYFVVTASGFLLIDLTGWGWIMLIWGSLLLFAGLGLLTAQSWARWFTIVAVSLNFLIQLGFLGNSNYPLWTLTALALNVIVLYALTARWDESTRRSRRGSLTAPHRGRRATPGATASSGGTPAAQSSAPGDACVGRPRRIIEQRPMFLLLAPLLFILFPLRGTSSAGSRASPSVSSRSRIGSAG